eukprot:TRINITY_DN14926_c0_g3_i1.p1 TRINITY_DN14926_c0_g3~~TRINITY_DN14926_c0_g3_i1.p1  ORF type:complete len:351 (+),score=91.13 TRINITY_DN14926_c0_g3_i1:102-1055(+)
MAAHHRSPRGVSGQGAMSGEDDDDDDEDFMYAHTPREEALHREGGWPDTAAHGRGGLPTDPWDRGHWDPPYAAVREQLRGRSAPSPPGAGAASKTAANAAALKEAQIARDRRRHRKLEIQRRSFWRKCAAAGGVSLVLALFGVLQWIIYVFCFRPCEVFVHGVTLTSLPGRQRWMQAAVGMNITVGAKNPNWGGSAEVRRAFLQISLVDLKAERSLPPGRAEYALPRYLRWPPPGESGVSVPPGGYVAVSFPVTFRAEELAEGARAVQLLYSRCFGVVTTGSLAHSVGPFDYSNEVYSRQQSYGVGADCPAAGSCFP